MLTRRDTMKLGGAAAVAAALPIGAVAAVEPPLLAFIVGTPGEHDAEFIRAATAKDAFEQWQDLRGLIFENACDLCEQSPCGCDASYYTTRVKRWDDIKGEPSGGQWIDAGFGYLCFRCDHEMGEGHNVDGEAVCQDCMTLADYKKTDPEYHAELLDELMTDEYGPDLRFPEWW